MSPECEHTKDIKDGIGCEQAHVLGHRQSHGLKELFESRKFSDFVVVCSDGERLRTHKAVLYSQSSYFRTLLSVNMKEKLEGVLTLPELPDVAKAIVTYMYTADYEAKSTESLPAFQFHAEMYAAALKYEMPDLCLAACNKLRLHATAGLFLTWEDDETKSQQDDDFLEAVAIVYGNTVNKDDQMRQQLALLARRKMLNAPSRTVERSWVKTMMQVPELAADVMSSITEALGWFNNHAKSRSALSCSDPKCSGVVIMETRTYTYYVERGATVTCQSCFEHNHAKNWIMQPTPDLSDMI